MRSKLVSITLATAFVSIFLSIFHSLHPLNPPSRDESSNKLRSSEVIRVVGAVGPESIAFDPSGGGPYTGVSDGRILKWEENLGWTEFAVTSPHYLTRRDECQGSHDPSMEHVCGRPLGLRFDNKTGDLYIADAYYGLLKVGPVGGPAEPLATEARGFPFRFTNDLDIDPRSGAIYFTDSSLRFQRRKFFSVIATLDKTARLMKYDTETKQVIVLYDGLAFANGVTLNKDGSFLLIAETTSCRILRYWLQTPKSGTLEVFAQLSGFPDNIRRSPRGDFWVALHSRRTKIMEWTLSNPSFVNALNRLLPIDIDKLASSLAGRSREGIVLRLSEEGETLEVLEDRGGKVLKDVSHVEERNGRLWLGSVIMPFVGVFKL